MKSLWRTPCLLCALGMQDVPPTTGGADRFLTAIVDYRAGRYEAACGLFGAELAAHGSNAPAALRINLALAALRVQRTSDAEQAIRPLLASELLAERAWAEFVLGSAAYQHGERAAAAARLPDSEPMAFESAVRSMQAAQERWCRAAELRDNWPEALRNGERATRRLAELKRQRDAAAAADKTKKTEPEPPPAPPSPPVDPRPEEVQPELANAPLTAAELLRLRQRLRERDRDKQLLRQAQQGRATVAGERDW